MTLMGGNGTCLGLFMIASTVVKPGQPKLDEISRNSIGVLRIAAPMPSRMSWHYGCLNGIE
ncbi:hypothetical protein [uncultured Pelagibacterium sp.]|uniref:hypothetical protein n=1 Tax=uncultured Pelagibacterium sp. TaxID=1159875 RepID=UPI0030DA4114|tara:strand:+ start:1934 stop:2116 length:183 start_codon:yes stop_codon:yes gene_type:complete